MRGNIEDRCIDFGHYIVENRATVRDCAARFDISKSTVHKDVTERLAKLNHPLYLAVREVLGENKAQRHLRGGLATQTKYRLRRDREREKAGQPAAEKSGAEV